MRTVRAVISAVTPGLPSRSPPIQLPGRRNAPTRGGRVPVRPESDAGAGERPVGGSRAASSARYSRGMTVNSVASKNAIAVRTSSSGVGLTTRRSDVRHSSVISSRRRRRTSRSSDGVRRGSSSRASRTAQRPSATSVVRRRASVGWAVKTGATTSRATSASSSASVLPSRRNPATASATESSRTPSRAARSRRRNVRTRPRASARLTRPKYSANASMTASASPRPSALSSSSRRARSAGSSSRRRAMVRRRMRSTVANSSGPACSAMTWPSSAPSSRTSRASGSRAPAEPIPRGSAATASETRGALPASRDRSEGTVPGPSRYRVATISAATFP